MAFSSSRTLPFQRCETRARRASSEIGRTGTPLAAAYFLTKWSASTEMSPGRSRSYVLSAGEMTLALELRDSVTGTLLAEARDRKRGPENATLTLSNNVVNRQEAERALRSWAGQLKKALDSARSVQ